MPGRSPRPILAAALLALTTAVVGASHEARTTEPDDLVTLRGCITGRTLVVTDVSGIRDGVGETLIGARFRLDASRAMLEALADHSGHEDEVTGTFDRTEFQREHDERLVAEEQIGRTRIYAGRRRSVGSERPILRPVGFDLDSFEHVEARCQSR